MRAQTTAQVPGLESWRYWIKKQAMLEGKNGKKNSPTFITEIINNKTASFHL